MALTPDQQQIIIEAESDLAAYLQRNPHMQSYQDELDKKLDVAHGIAPEEILKEGSKSLKKTKKKLVSN
jgi:hypothetical protein